MRWLLTLGLLWTTSLANTEDWSRFRGPNGTGVSPQSLPTKWTEKDYLWKIAVPGLGHSSPVAWDNQIYVTSADGKAGKQLVLCFSADTGKEKWRHKFASAPYKMHKRNTSATSTPTVDSQRLYFAWASPKQYLVYAVDRMTGKDVWKVDLGPYIGGHGFGASLMLYEDLLVLTNEQDKKGSLLALDSKTGKKVWEVPRNSGNATYSTPCVYQPAGQAPTLIFTNWQHGITALDPRTGKMRWETSVFEPKKQERAIVSPIIAGDLVIGTCGFVTAQKHFVAVRPTNDGKATEVWRMEKPVAYLPTPVVKDGKIYSCTEKGFLSCINAADAKVIWQERLEGEFSASTICAGKAIYCVNNDGDVYVVETGEKFKQLARNSLGEGVQATPAIVGNRLIIRTTGHLIAIAGPK